MAHPATESIVTTAPRSPSGVISSQDVPLPAASQAKCPSWASLAYMAAEGAIAITAAVRAGSVALLGLGVPSVIEGAGSIIIVWRFSGTRTLSETAERRAQKAVAVSFFTLAPYIKYDAITKLARGEHPAMSWLGIGLAITSLMIMPFLGVAKKRVRARLDPGTAALLPARPRPGAMSPSPRASPAASGWTERRLVL
jgi:hypothetical protein